MSSGRLTIITSSRPATPGKRFSLSGGSLDKETAGQLVLGQYEVVSFDGAAALAALLASLSTSQALCASTPRNGSEAGGLVSKALQAQHPRAITRTKEAFAFESGQRGAFVLDFDPPASGAMTQGELWQCLLSVAPQAAACGAVWWASGSSHIWANGTELQGLRGQRLYLLMADVSDTQRAMKVLAQRLWLAGLGRVDVSDSGALLLRSVFDEAMAQPARLDFIGGAVCTAPVEQRRGVPVVLSEGGWLDTREALPDLTADEQGRYEAKVAEAKAAARGEAEARRAAWVRRRIAEGLPAAMARGASASEAEGAIRATLDAAFGGTLLGDFELIVVREDGRREVVTVDHLLRHRDQYHESNCLDPLNPGHRDGAADARLYLLDASPILYSLDDGGQVYRLRRQLERVEFSAGSRSAFVEGVAAALGRQDDIFLTGAGPAQVVDGKVLPLTASRLMNLIGSRVAMFRSAKGGKAVPFDIPKETAELVLAELQAGH